MFAGPFRRLASALAALMILAACAAKPAPPPASEACVLAAVSSNGWHAGLYLPAEVFDEDGPLRAWRPEADWFAIGWGDAAAYPQLGPLRAAAAVLWPTESVLHAAWFERDPRRAYRSDHVDLALSRDQAQRLAAAIEADLRLGEDGAVRLAGPGLDARGSAFLDARPRYHLFNTCNVWLARRLEAAGLETGWTGGHLLPASLLRALERRAPQACAEDLSAEAR